MQKNARSCGKKGYPKKFIFGIFLAKLVCPEVHSSSSAVELDEKVRLLLYCSKAEPCVNLACGSESSSTRCKMIIAIVRAFNLNCCFLHSGHLILQNVSKIASVASNNLILYLNTIWLDGVLYKIVRFYSIISDFLKTKNIEIVRNFAVENDNLWLIVAHCDTGWS